MKGIRTVGSIGFYLLSISLLVGLTACIEPKTRTIVGPSGIPAQYRKVYIARVGNDFRNVHARLVARLRRCGFEVAEIEANSTIGAQGTGFVVSEKGGLITCAHLLHHETNVTAWVEGIRHLGYVTALNTNLDLALVTLESATNYYPIPFSAVTNYHMGEEVFAMGFPLADLLGAQPRLNKGLISATVGMADDPKELQVSVETQPGNSGGPLFDRDGRVIGIMRGTLNPLNVLVRTGGGLPQNVNFATKSGPLQEFLRTNGISLLQREAPTNSFEEAKRSLALVRAGIVEDNDLKGGSLLCRYTYVGSWQFSHQLRVFYLEFYDLKTGECVLKAGGGNQFGSEDRVMDKTFEQIHATFFPNRPNPFRGKQPKPAPESKS